MTDIQTSWQMYYNIDGQIRTAANNGPQHLHQAEVVSTGDSNKAFGKFTDAVDRLKQANYAHYNITLNTTQTVLNVYILLSAIIFPFIGLSAVLGVLQRFRDL